MSSKQLIARLIAVVTRTINNNRKSIIRRVISVNVTGNNIAPTAATTHRAPLSLTDYLPVSLPLSCPGPTVCCAGQVSLRRRQRQCLGNGNILSIIQ